MNRAMLFAAFVFIVPPGDVRAAAPKFTGPPARIILADRHLTLCGRPPGSEGGPCATYRDAYVVLGPVRPKADLVPPQALAYLAVNVELLTGYAGSTCDDDPEFTALVETGATTLAESEECPTPHPQIPIVPQYGLVSLVQILDFGAFTRTATVYFQQGQTVWTRSGVAQFAAQEVTGNCADPGVVSVASGFVNVEVCP